MPTARISPADEPFDGAADESSKPPYVDPPRSSSRRVWVIAGLAAVILAIGGFAGAKALSGGGSKPATSASPSGGATGRGGRGTVGTLQSVDGSTLTVASFNGNTTTVLTSSSTKFLKSVTGSVSDIKVGDRVVAMGTPSGTNTVAAQRLSDMGAGGAGFGGRQGPPGTRIRRFGNGTAPDNGPNGGAPPDPNSLAAGTVKSVSGTTLTVAQNDGTTKTVTTTPSTAITVLKPAVLQDLTTGDQVAITGTTNTDGTVTARTVREGAAGAIFGFGRGGRGGGGGGPGGSGGSGAGTGND